jgi:hypothetical protein
MSKETKTLLKILTTVVIAVLSFIPSYAIIGISSLRKQFGFWESALLFGVFQVICLLFASLIVYILWEEL